MNTSGVLQALRQELSGDSHDDADPLHSDVAFRLLLQRIVSLRYEPGEWLTERKVMDELSISRPSLRIAVAHLSDLGLIRPVPRKGLQVAVVDAFEVAAVYDARVAIEAKVARLAAGKVSEEMLDELRSRAEEHHRIDNGEDKARSFLEHDQALHLGLAEVAGNRFLEDALTRILPVSARMWRWVYLRLGPDTRTMFSHLHILDAVASGDPDAAEAAVQQHLDQGRTALMDTLQRRLSRG